MIGLSNKMNHRPGRVAECLTFTRWPIRRACRGGMGAWDAEQVTVATGYAPLMMRMEAAMALGINAPAEIPSSAREAGWSVVLVMAIRGLPQQGRCRFSPTKRMPRKNKPGPKTNVFSGDIGH